MSILIHADEKIRWQIPFAKKMLQGLKQIGIHAEISPSRYRESDIAILCGTTLWKQIEKDGHYLLVDRCSFGDTNEWVSLVWDGHGRRGDHCVPEDKGDRWKSTGIKLRKWKKTGNRIVLCGQSQAYSPHYERLEDWYGTVQKLFGVTHFRKHPSSTNPTSRPLAKDWQDCGLAVTLNSSIGVETVISGIPTVTMDEAAMAWDVTGHSLDAERVDRRSWARWLAWTQWRHDEISDGEPIRHLFEAM